MFSSARIVCIIIIFSITSPLAPEEFASPNITRAPRKLNITWAPPRKPNGQIRFYQVFIEK